MYQNGGNQSGETFLMYFLTFPQLSAEIQRFVLNPQIMFFGLIFLKRERKVFENVAKFQT